MGESASPGQGKLRFCFRSGLCYVRSIPLSPTLSATARTARAHIQICGPLDQDSAERVRSVYGGAGDRVSDLRLHNGWGGILFPVKGLGWGRGEGGLRALEFCCFVYACGIRAVIPPSFTLNFFLCLAIDDDQQLIQTILFLHARPWTAAAMTQHTGELGYVGVKKNVVFENCCRAVPIVLSENAQYHLHHCHTYSRPIMGRIASKRSLRSRQDAVGQAVFQGCKAPPPLSLSLSPRRLASLILRIIKANENQATPVVSKS